MEGCHGGGVADGGRSCGEMPLDDLLQLGDGKGVGHGISSLSIHAMGTRDGQNS
jgi:hypothetical protein